MFITEGSVKDVIVAAIQETGKQNGIASTIKNGRRTNCRRPSAACLRAKEY